MSLESLGMVRVRCYWNLHKNKVSVQQKAV